MDFIKGFFKFVFAFIVIAFLTGLWYGMKIGHSADYSNMQDTFKIMNMTQHNMDKINKEVFPNIDSNTTK